MELSPLILALREIIKQYCTRHKISTMSAFAELAVVDRDTISDICHKPNFVVSWKIVTAIAVACDLPTDRIKSELRPLYNQCALTRTTAQQRVVRKDIARVSSGTMSTYRQRTG